MLFDLLQYAEDMRENPEKREIIQKYEKLFGPLQGGLIDQLRYTDYISKFSVLDYLVPEELKTDFDWKILMQLVAGSFSSNGSFDYHTDGLPDFVVSVQSGDQVVVKKVSELWGFQIVRLYEIYVEEQMNLQVMISEDNNEKDIILSQREGKISRRKLVFDNLDKEKLQQQEQHDKKEKLENLYGQL